MTIQATKSEHKPIIKKNWIISLSQHRININHRMIINVNREI